MTTECMICGRRLRSDNRRGRCRSHGTSKTFDAKTGTCLTCGEVVSDPAKRGGHATSCGRSVWNKGLTREEDPRVASCWNKGFTKRDHPKLASVSRKNAERWKDPEHRARQAERISEAQRRRFEDPEQREASRRRALEMISAGKIVPYGGRRHGNGRGPTRSETAMMDRLGGLGFVSEYVVRTWAKRGSGLPFHYKIDLANPEKKVAVEIDGSSHSPRRRKADSRKDFFLASTGWRVLRFRVPFDFDEAARTCAEVAGS